jgi:hypothetical protein
MVVSLQKLFLNVKNRYIQNKRKENWRDKIQDQMNCSYNDEICKQRIENYPIPLKNEYPCFIFAASWRTGSTLIQRLINASGEIYLWPQNSVGFCGIMNISPKPVEFYPADFLFLSIF